MSILIWLFVMAYITGAAYCYHVCSKDIDFVESFKNLPTSTAWTLFTILIILWPVVLVCHILDDDGKK